MGVCVMRCRRGIDGAGQDQEWHPLKRPLRRQALLVPVMFECVSAIPSRMNLSRHPLPPTMLSTLRSSPIPRTASRLLKHPSSLSRWSTVTAAARQPSRLAFRSISTSLPLCNNASSCGRPYSTTVPQKEEHASSTLAPTQARPSPQDEPKMAIAFTCTVPKCGHRQAHMFSKRSYEKGIVIVTCSGCKNRCVMRGMTFVVRSTDTGPRHLIADHLGWFDNLTGDGANVTIEKLAKAHGVPVTRGAIGGSGVFEYDGEPSSNSSDEPLKSS